MNAPVDIAALMGAQAQASPAVDPTKTWLRRGYLALGFLVVGIGGWAAVTDIKGAVVAPGVVVVENRARDVQHLDGGIVLDVLVRDGQTVEAGEVLMRLDPTLTDANRDIVLSRLYEIDALIARLDAERDGAREIIFPERLLASSDPKVERALEGQRRLFRARRTAAVGQVNQLRQQIRQSAEQIEGLNARIGANTRQIASVDDELAGLQELLAKGFVPKTRVLALEREQARLQGENATAASDIARIKSAISETQVRISQIERDRLTEVLSELRGAQTEAAELRERETTALDQSRRIEIRSPVAGRVLNSGVNTVGEVIAPGEVLMQIVPSSERLIIETQVDPAKIDEVYPGQVATVRLSAFNQRTTPELGGEVLSTAADRSIDEVTGVPYYEVRVVVPEDQMARLPESLQLLPGMPAEAFMQTEERSVLSYLVKPAQDAMSRTWREE